jgi:lipopolysaccharide export system permease protein
MIKQKTLSIYLFKLYCNYFISILLLLIGILIISNIFDILQKFKDYHIPISIFWRLVLYKIPYLVNEVSSLVSFIAMLAFLKKLTKYNELIALLCGGIHIWKIIIAPVCATMVIGMTLVAIYNSMGIAGLKKHEFLQNKLSKKEPNNLVISKSGLMLLENYQNEKRLIHIGSFDIVNNKLSKIIILFLDKNNYFLKRIDAQQAILVENNFKLINVKTSDQHLSKQYDNLDVPTNLSINNLLNNFTPPEMIAIWNLPKAIHQLVQAGFPVTNYQIYYYKQLFKPIIMVTSVILAACFFSLKQRDNSQGKILVIGLCCGFISYSALEILFKILAYNISLPFLAVLLPNIGILLLSNIVIMNSQKV